MLVSFYANRSDAGKIWFAGTQRRRMGWCQTPNFWRQGRTRSGRISAMSADNPQTIRSFVAIELPPEARAWCQAALERARRGLGPHAAAVRWVAPASVHLTLKFLGGVPAPQVPALIERLQAELAGQEPFSLAVGKAGVFPGPRTARVLWLALLGELPSLSACQQRVELATVPLGFPGEKRPFQPHLTLGRVRETATTEQRAAAGALPAGWPTGTSQQFPVESVSLMQSHLGPGGARYTRLAEIPFRAAGS